MNFVYENNMIWYGGTKEAPLAYIQFPVVEEGKENCVVVAHTVVDESLRGQGLAGKLVQAMAEQLRTDGRKAKLKCSYAVKWFEKHEEYRDVLEEE